VLPLLASARLLDSGRAVGRMLGGSACRRARTSASSPRGHASLADPEAGPPSFTRCGRSWSRAASGSTPANRLYLAENIPFMLVWGDRDPIIPVEHGIAAHELVPSSRLEIFEGAGHFPHLDDPQRFLDVLLDFIESTEPADTDAEAWKDMLSRDGAARRGDASAEARLPGAAGAPQPTGGRAPAQAANPRPPSVPVTVSRTPAAAAAATPSWPRMSTAAAAPHARADRQLPKRHDRDQYRDRVEDDASTPTACSRSQLRRICANTATSTKPTPGYPHPGSETRRGHATAPGPC
jgi:hypothetical protein